MISQFGRDPVRALGEFEFHGTSDSWFSGEFLAFHCEQQMYPWHSIVS